MPPVIDVVLVVAVKNPFSDGHGTIVSRIKPVPPYAVGPDPAALDLGAGGIREKPLTAIVDPAGCHDAGTGKVIIRAIVVNPFRLGHYAIGLDPVPPYAVGPDPAALDLSAGGICVVPLPAVLDPPGGHGTRGRQIVFLAVNVNPLGSCHSPVGLGLQPVPHPVVINPSGGWLGVCIRKEVPRAIGVLHPSCLAWLIDRFLLSRSFGFGFIYLRIFDG